MEGGGILQENVCFSNNKGLTSRHSPSSIPLLNLQLGCMSGASASILHHEATTLV